LMMEAVSSSEMSVSMYQTTRRNIPEDSNINSCYREDLKSHCLLLCNRRPLFDHTLSQFNPVKSYLSNIPFNIIPHLDLVVFACACPVHFLINRSNVR
jgi:hypothetical protein